MLRLLCDVDVVCVRAFFLLISLVCRSYSHTHTIFFRSNLAFITRINCVLLTFVTFQVYGDEEALNFRPHFLYGNIFCWCL